MTRVSTSFSRTNLKLHNISRTSKMVKNVITNLGSSKAFDCDCIPAVVLKNCELELSYILAELFNICRKESSRLLEVLISGPCIYECWGKVYLLKTTALLVFFLWLVKSLKDL